MVQLVLDLIVTLSSIVLFVYWLHLACLLLLVADHEVDDLLELLDGDQVILSRLIFGDPRGGLFEWLDRQVMGWFDQANRLLLEERQAIGQARHSFQIRVCGAGSRLREFACCQGPIKPITTPFWRIRSHGGPRHGV